MLSAYSTISNSISAVPTTLRLPQVTCRCAKAGTFRSEPRGCGGHTPSPEEVGTGVVEVSSYEPAAAATTTTTAAAFILLPPAPELLGASPQGRWNAVSLAYLGDAVWEAMLRSRFYNASNTWQYGNKVAAMVTTQAQAACYLLLQREGWLTHREAALMRWASNNSSVSPPPHATRQQYKQATALEALVANLYLTDVARLQQLMAWLLQPGRVEQWQQQLPVPAHSRHKANSRSTIASPAPSKWQATKPNKEYGPTRTSAAASDSALLLFRGRQFRNAMHRQ